MIEPQYVQTNVDGTPLTEEEQAWVDDHDIRLEPFEKKNWKSPSSREGWRDVLQRAARGKSEAEWRSVLDGRTERRAAIIHVNNYNREAWLRRVSEHDLVYRDIRFTRPHQGFAHGFTDTDVDDLERITYAVVAQDVDVADEFVEAETELGSLEKHDVVGELLGFPECCRDFFADVWASQGQIDPMYEVACNSGNAEAIDGDREDVLIRDPDPWNNVLYRYFGWAFITHIPCSWDCEASMEIARSRGELMADNGYKDAANALWEWLSEPMVWTGYHGICHLVNQHFLGSSSTSDYWSKKRIVWGEENAPGGSVI